MQFLLIVGSSLLEDRAPMYEIIGSATTICALAWLDVKTAFLGPNATRLPLNGPFREAFVWWVTMPAGVVRGMRELHAAPATRHSRRGCTNHHRSVVGAPLEHQQSDRFLAPLGLVALHLPIPPWIPSGSPMRGLANDSASLYCLPGPCHRDLHGAHGREGRSAVYRSHHWWTPWNTRMS